MTITDQDRDRPTQQVTSEEVADMATATITPRSAASQQVKQVSARVSLKTKLLEIWHSRELMSFLVRTEVKVKYKNSILGFLWSMLNPAMTIAVYFIVFKIIVRSTVPRFVIYLFAGVLVWNLFSSAVTSATSSLVSNSGLVKKVSFPREVLPISEVGTACVFFSFQAIVLAVVLAAFGYSPAWGYMWLLIPAFLALIVFTAALAVLLSSINVYLRDTHHLLEIVLIAWFWGVPIVYPYSSAMGALSRHGLGFLYLMDPIAPVVVTFQRAIYAIVSYIPPGSTTRVFTLPTGGQMWFLKLDIGVLAGSIVLFLISLVIFGRIEGNFAEEL